jgi:hypothetical protein
MDKRKVTTAECERMILAAANLFLNLAAAKKMPQHVVHSVCRVILAMPVNKDFDEATVKNVAELEAIKLASEANKEASNGVVDKA